MKRLRDILTLAEMSGENAIRANDPFFKIEKNITIDNIYGGKNYVQLLHHDKKGAPPVVTEHGHHIYYSHELVPYEKNVGIFKMALVDPKTKSVDFHVQGSTILHPRMGRSLPEFTLEDLSLRSKDKDNRSIQGSNSHPLYRTIMKFGGIITQKNFRPDVVSSKNEEISSLEKVIKEYSTIEGAVYIDDEFFNRLAVVY